MKKFFFLFLLPLFLNADLLPIAAADAGSTPTQEESSKVTVPQKSNVSWQKLYNDGREDYYKEDYSGANEKFSKALSKCSKPENQEQIFYNLGNTLYQQSQSLDDADPQKIQHLEKSVQNFQSALSLNKEAKDTQNNLKLAQQELDRVNDKRKKDKNKQDNDGNNDKNSKNNQDKQNNQGNKNNQNNPNNQNNSQDQKNQQGNQDQKDQPENKSPDKQPQQGNNPPQDQNGNQQPNPSPQSNQPKPQGSSQQQKQSQDPKKQEIANILKKAANSEKMFPLSNHSKADDPVVKNW